MHWDEQHPCNGSTFSPDEDGCRNQPESGSVYGPLGLGGLSSTTSPEIGGYLNAHPRVRQVTWSETATNRMLFEAGVGLYQAPFGPVREPGQHRRGRWRASPSSAPPAARPTAASPTSPTARRTGPTAGTRSTPGAASVSYVTGAHNLKVGYGGVALVSDLQSFTNDQNLSFTVQQRRADRSSRRACCPTPPATARGTCRSTCRTSGRADA